MRSRLVWLAAGAVVALTGACAKDPCVPNPCLGSDTGREVCEAVEGLAVCRCQPGYAEEPGGCASLPTWSCDWAHEGEGEDQAEPDECPPLAKNVLPSGNRSERSIYPAGDEDWFALVTEPGRVYRLTAAGFAEGATPLVELFDESGTRLIVRGGEGQATAEVLFGGPTRGRAMARVRALKANVFDYDVWLEDIGEDDFPNDPVEATRVSPGAAFGGELTYVGDSDVVLLEVPALAAVRLDFNRDPTSRANLEVTRDDGVRVTVGGPLFLADSRARTYLLVVSGWGAGPAGPWNISTTFVGDDDLPDEIAFAHPWLPDPQWQQARFDRPSDLDSVRIHSYPGHCYQASLTPLSGTSGRILATDKNGRLLRAANGDVSWCARDGEGLTAFQFVHQLPSTPGAYRWRVQDIGEDDFPDYPDAGQPLAFDTPISGRLEDDDDTDSFQFDGTAGHIIRFKLEPSDGLGLFVWSGSGSRLFEVNDTFILPTSGSWRVVVRPATHTASVAPYRLTVTDLGVDDYDSQQPAALALGTPRDGVLESRNDVDCFSFTGSAARIYRSQLSHQSISTPNMTVTDASGLLIASLPNVRFVSSVDGAVRLCVLGSLSDALGPYTLQVSDDGPEDHVATRLGATPYSAFGARMTGTISTPMDVDTFRVETVQGRIYQLRCETSAPGPCLVRVTDEQGLVKNWPNTATPGLLVADATAPLYLSVSRESEVAPFSYELIIDDLGVDDFGNTPATASRMVLGTQLTGAFDYSSDTDALLVADTADHVFEADCEQPSGPCWLGASASGNNSLASGFGAVRWLGRGRDVVLELRGAIGPWALQVADLGPDDYVGVAPLTVGSPLTGALQWTADADRFSFQVPTERAYRVRCDSTTAAVCKLDLRENRLGGLWTGADATSSGSAEIAAWLNASHTFTLTVGAGAVGAYTLNVDAIPDDFGNTSATGSGIQPGTGPVQGTIEYLGDLDVFLVDFRAAGTGPRSVSIQGAGLRAAIRRPDGFTEGTADQSNAVAIPSPMTGVYVITVSTAGAVPPAAYTLTVN